MDFNLLKNMYVVSHISITQLLHDGSDGDMMIMIMTMVVVAVVAASVN
jgi:hypothetical protein